MADPTHYTPTKWQDDVPEIQAGTPFDQVRMNNIEQGILAGNITLALLSRHANMAALEADNARPVRISTTMTGSGVATAVAIPANLIRNHVNYSVAVELVTVTGGTAGDLIVSSKQANGFSVKYTGTATSVAAICAITGGII